MKKPSDMRNMIPLWLIGQTELPKIIRWSKYVDANPKLRKQNTLEHSWGLSVFAGILLNQLKGVIHFNEGLILRCITIHDVSEGILRLDTLFADKTAEKDLNEYVAFVEEIKHLDEEIKKSLKETFLLQFAQENPECFPNEARKIMTRLWKYERNSVLLFQLIEKLDYIMYALESYKRCRDEVLLVQVLRNQCPKIDKIAEALPELRFSIWTNDLRNYFNQKLEKLGHVRAETKSTATV